MPKQKKTRGEVLAAKRVKERERYQKLKDDPIKYELQKEKERRKYENKKKKKQIKMVKEMTTRELRLKRKQWRTNSLNYIKKKKLNKNGPETPPSSDGEESVPQPSSQNMISSQKRSGRQQLRRERSKTVKKNKALGQENRKLKTMLEKYKKKYYRLKNPTSSQNGKPKEMTPRTKVKHLIKTKNKELVKRRLLFGMALESQIKSNFNTIDSVRFKKKFVSSVIGNATVLKKCRVLHELKTVFTKRLQRCSKNYLQDRRQHKAAIKIMKEDVHKFYLDDENSRLAPGKKDCKTLNKIKKQKRYLNDTLINLHKSFLKSVPYKVSYAYFCKLRPFWVVYQRPNERDTCQCKIHTNTTFIVSALHHNKIIGEKTPKELAESLCCSYNVSCLLRSCTKCQDKQVAFKEFDGDSIVNYYEWSKKREIFKDRNGHIKKVFHTIKLKKLSNAMDLVNKLDNILNKFMKHEGIIQNQFSQLKLMKTNMEENEVLVHMDFSENYACKYASEIQSFHFGGSRQQISLHTTSVSLKESSNAPIKTKSFCTFSTNLNHSPVAILAHLTPVLNHLRKVKPNLRFVHFLSDSPSNQYRNKLMFYIFGHEIKYYFPMLQISTWNYYESGHGKGAPDGIGGTVKRTADRLVSLGKDIDCIDALISSLKDNLRSVDISIISENNIAEVNRRINFQDVVAFKGTMTVHQVVQVHDVLKPCSLTMKSMSCFKCFDQCREKLANFDCNHYNLGTIEYPSDTFAQEPMEEVEESFETNNQPDKNVYWKDIQPGRFILVRFEGQGKKTYRYVCSILKTDEEDGEIVVQGLSLKNDSGNEFTVADDKDVSSIMFEDVLEILQDPEVMCANRLRGLTYKFPREIDVYEHA